MSCLIKPNSKIITLFDRVLAFAADPPSTHVGYTKPKFGHFA